MKKPNKIFALLMLLMTFSMSKAFAADEFYVKSIDVDANAPATIECFLTNEIPYYGFQAEISLPAGLALRNVTLNEKLVDGGYDLVTNTANGKILIAAFSNKNAEISSNFGNFMNINVDVASNFVEGTVIISKIKFVNSDKKDVPLPDTEALIGIAAKSIEVSPSAINLVEGDTADLTATISPSTTRDKTIIWSSSNEAVAIVSTEGKVSAIKEGEATITASTVNGKTATCTVTVSQRVILPTGIILSDTELNMKVGEVRTVTATVVPEDATDKSITWTSGNPSIATVDGNGNVTAVGPGTTTITVTASNGITATITVTVTEKEPEVIPATSISLDRTTLNMVVDQIETLVVTVLPEDATDKSVTWTSSDNSVATVDQNGKVTAIAAGEATITASCGTLSATCNVTVAPNTIPVTGITLSDTNLDMKVGDTRTVTVTIEPENATDKSVTWTSGNPSIATVDENGNVTAVGPGTTTITVTTSNGISETITVTVTEKEPEVIPATSLSLDRTTLNMVVDQIETLVATVLPEDATDKSVTWTSSDNSVATVDQNGKVTAIAAGSVTITAGCGTLTATCAVTVAPKTIPVTGITLSDTELNMKVGDVRTVTATVEPEDATDKSITWTSGNPSIATVDGNGNVTAIGLGTTTITVTASNGITATIIVTVTEKEPEVIPATSISLDRTTLNMVVDQIETLVATVLPEDATDKSVVWTSSNNSIASVDQNGNVTAIAAGEATITASCGTLSATCAVTVAPKSIPVTGITLSDTNLDMKVGDTRTVTVTIEPENATDKSVTWTSGDNSIATVDENGNVTAVGPGTTTITVTTSNGISETITVTVTEKEPEVIPATSISLDRTTLNMAVDQIETLVATVLPEDATDKSVTWTSSDNSVATVDQNGKVTATAAGEATITASCGTLSASCSVIVSPITVASISLSNNSLELKVGDTDKIVATVTPDNAEDKNIIWASSNENVATVDNEGNVVAIAIGTTTITATCGNVYASCLVTVVPTPAESIEINPSEATLTVGDDILISASVLPENTTDPTIVWISNNPTIATVDNDGKVSAIANGSAVITARCGEATAECMINVVNPPANQIDLTPNTADIKVGENIAIKADIYPANAADKTIKWSSDNPGIAIVDESGIITGVALGETTINAICGQASATCIITVIPTPVESITLTNTELLMRVGKTAEIAAIVAPTDATDQSIFWSSDNEQIATVDANGIISALTIGQATITATSVSNPSVKANCNVTVEDAAVIVAVSEISISDKSLELLEGDTYLLNATIKPEDASDNTLTWRSSDTTKATVSDNGEVTAIAEGEAIIYVSSSNGLTAECSVTVKARIVSPTGITLSRSELLMREGYTSDLIAIVRPDNASDKSVVWTTSDQEIATVDNNGKVTAVKQGNCVIAASTSNGHTATCEVTVVPVVVAVEDITLNKYELDMAINETFTLIATITPADATDQNVTWRSSDANIANVSEYGLVTALSAGTTTIYASSSNGKTVECAVTVRPGEIAVESISISQSELLMREGFTSELFAIVHPDEATDKTVFWSTSDPAIAIVDDNGVVTAISPGNAIITASSTNEKTAICNVTVIPFVISVENIIIDPTSVEIEINETYQLTATITPDDASDKTITWKALDKGIAIVSETGLVTGISAGTTIVYASSSNGKTVECQVTVRQADVEATGISLTNTELLMIEGDTSELLAIVHPDNATDKTVVWSSSDESIATVDQNGIVTAIHQGYAIITATTANGKSATCSVIVTIIPVESITLNKTSMELIVEETETLTATIAPDNATDKTVTWKSSNREVATVNENGLVTAVGVGSATIYASSSNGLTAECEVTVKPGIIAVEGISLSNTELLMREGYSTEIIAIVRPDNATDKTVTWSTDNPSIATFDANENKAIINANAVGTAIITVTSNFDPSIKAQCIVTVQKEEEITAVASITLNKTAVTMTEGDVKELIAIITPDDATDKSVTWKSSDKEIAIVSDTGNVTAIKEGTAIIYASSSNGLTAECEVTVKPAYVEVTSVSLTNTELLMREGHTADLIAIVRPDNATDKSITWSSSDESIATVDQNGIVTAIHVGKATITASSYNGIRANCYVTVVPDVIPVEGISITPTALEMEVDDTYTLTATLTPEEASDKSITWRSSDRAIAIVAEDGTVTAIAAGTATIYASSSNGLTAECMVTVNPTYEEVISISLTNTEMIMIEGDTSDLIAIIRPDNATDKSVIWASSDESIVTVDDNGIVNAIKRGNAIITASASNGVKAECYVTVLPRIIAVESISISDSEIDLTVGDVYSLTATISPEDATDKTITWKSSNLAIATVSGNGVVTAIAEGTASIYASSSNGLTAECIVNVHPGIIEVESITLTNTELLMREGFTADLIAIISPENATDKSVTWASTDEEIATVDQNGIVTAIHQGNTIVSATANNGVQALCNVTVVPVVIAVEDIAISKTELTLTEGDDYQLTAYVIPDDATDKTITWKSTDREVATVSEDGLVTAIKVGTTTIYASSSNGLTKECLVTVEPLIIEVSDIAIEPTTLILSEGETAALTATLSPEDATDKTITWISADPKIATVKEGVVAGIKEGTTTITASSANGLNATCIVTVYTRPLTPKQLLRKGDGTSCTFVVMMDLSDTELEELGYRFVYGYNDASGQSHVIEETPLRYAHTSSEIYNDPTNDFWVFSLLENNDGVLLNSNLRHLDGSEEICFNASKYGYPTKGEANTVAAIESEEWITVTPSGLLISPIGVGDKHVAIYTMTGLQVYARSYKGQGIARELIEFSRFTPDTYVAIVRCGGKVISKKIVIR